MLSRVAVVVSPRSVRLPQLSLRSITGWRISRSARLASGGGGGTLAGALVASALLGTLGAAGGAIAGALTGRDLGPHGEVPSLKKPGLALGAAVGGVLAIGLTLKTGRGVDPRSTHVITTLFAGTTGILVGGGLGFVGGAALTGAGNLARLVAPTT